MNIINDGVLFNTREYYDENELRFNGKIMAVTRQVVTLQQFATGTHSEQTGLYS